MACEPPAHPFFLHLFSPIPIPHSTPPHPAELKRRVTCRWRGSTVCSATPSLQADLTGEPCLSEVVIKKWLFK